MKYKLIASDMDGTLLTSNGTITDRTKDALHNATDRGVVFTVSSGRPPVAVEKYADRLPENSHIIAHNGAMITRLGVSEPLYQCPLEKETALEILDHAKRLGAVYVAWCGNTLYASNFCEYIDIYRSLSDVEPLLMPEHSKLVETPISKILLIAEIDVINSYIEYFDSNLKNPATYCTSDPHFLEIFSNDVSKALALKWLCNHLHIDISETIAFGDGYNDLEMLKTAGLGVAMDNACDEIKSMCQLVAPPNNDDGVAKVIENLILSN